MHARVDDGHIHELYQSIGLSAFLRHARLDAKNVWLK